jgi:hypothetical protein
VVASDLADLRAATDEERLCIDYVPPADPAALASALEAQLADPQRQTAYAQHNLEVMGRLSLAHTCSRYVELFEQARRRQLARA